MKKVLFVATVLKKHIEVFHLPYLEYFRNNGYEVHVAARNDYENKEECITSYCDKYYDLPFERSPFKKNNIIVYKELKKIIDCNEYDIIHCHTPVGGVLSRLAAIKSRKNGTKVIYTAHGFHFFKGSPKINWLVYYPIEKYLSKYTDVLITINEEDFDRTIKGNFRAKKIELVHGVGINLKKFSPVDTQQKYEIRTQYKYSKEDFIMIFVGELNYNKHQDILIRVVKELKKDIPNIKLLLVGKGEYYNKYSELIQTLNLEDYIELLGYREDVSELMQLSDVSLSSSRREGLPINVMEAMAVGLPLVVSECRGNRDLVIDGVNGFVVTDNIESMRTSILNLYQDNRLIRKFSNNNLEDIKKLSIERILDRMSKIYM